jgi:DNA-binding SARP family transcriptional activator
MRREGSMQSRPISRTKVTPALCRDTTLRRDRLLTWLDENIRRRVILLVAEAGYGKTTLLADFSQRTAVRCLWYKLDASDRHWATFVAYLAAAGLHSGAGFGTATLDAFASSDSETGRDIVVDALLADFEHLHDQPTALILDDFHLVDDSEDVRYVLSRIVSDAPSSLCVVVSSRRTPQLPLARLRYQGELAELGTEALRFSRQETHELFRDTYGYSLDPDLMDEIDQRTEGWPASLLLVHSSIRDRSESAIRAFVSGLNGARGSLYEFLAQEVLDGLSPPARRVLVRASLLDRVFDSWVAAMFTGEAEPPDAKEIEDVLNEAEAGGLLTRRGEASDSRRFHPLMRDFLQRQLHEHTSSEEIVELHARVARCAEEEDWAVACQHYLSAGQPAQAARVLASSALDAVGTGRWGEAADIVRQLTGTQHDPAVDVLATVPDIYAGNVRKGIGDLKQLRLASSPPLARSLARHALSRAHWSTGDGAGLGAVSRELSSDAQAPPELREIAEAYLAMRDWGTRPIRGLSELLVNMADRQFRAGHYYFAGVSWHNAMVVEYERAEFRVAIALGSRAIEAFGRTGEGSMERPATHAYVAECFGELGLPNQALEHASVASAEDVHDVAALSRVAYRHAVEGDTAAAKEVLLRIDSDHDRTPNADSSADLLLATARVHLCAGDAKAAQEVLNNLGTDTPGINITTTALGLGAMASLALGQTDRAKTLIEKALSLAAVRGARRWRARLEIISAAASGDGLRLTSAVQRAPSYGSYALLETAEQLADCLHMLQPLPGSVADSIDQNQARWLPLLRAQLEAGPSPAARAAADTLERHGTASDVSRLRAFEKTYLRRAGASSMAKSLSRRVSPKLFLNDLGRGSITVGARTLDLSRVRRKAASLLAFLVTRHQNTATREQVLDALWPELEPSSAANSLNQTVYFLRRHIDPWYEEDASADYVHASGDVLWIDHEMVSIASVEFERAASAALRPRDPVTEDCLRALALYGGRFLPEFEYDDWATAWRERLHALYLHLAQAAHVSLAAEARFAQAAEVAQQALRIEPEAIDIERNLISIYGSLGARSSAAELYQHYSASHRDQFGVDPPSLAELIQPRSNT